MARLREPDVRAPSSESDLCEEYLTLPVPIQVSLDLVRLPRGDHHSASLGFQLLFQVDAVVSPICCDIVAPVIRKKIRGRNDVRYFASGQEELQRVPESIYDGVDLGGETF